jgi:ABC-type branched-subunit amino acid transport system permease subunit
VDCWRTRSRYLTPEGFGLILSLELVLMVTIGGLGSLRGAILGAMLISMLPTFISRIKPILPEADRQAVRSGDLRVRPGPGACSCCSNPRA